MTLPFCTAYRFRKNLSTAMGLKLRWRKSGAIKLIHTSSLPLTQKIEDYAEEADWLTIFGIEEENHKKFNCNQCKWKLHCLVEPDSERLFEPR